MHPLVCLSLSLIPLKSHECLLHFSVDYYRRLEIHSIRHYFKFIVFLLSRSIRMCWTRFCTLGFSVSSSRNKKHFLIPRWFFDEKIRDCDQSRSNPRVVERRRSIDVSSVHDFYFLRRNLLDENEKFSSKNRQSSSRESGIDALMEAFSETLLSKTNRTKENTQCRLLSRGIITPMAIWCVGLHHHRRRVRLSPPPSLKEK